MESTELVIDPRNDGPCGQGNSNLHAKHSDPLEIGAREEWRRLDVQSFLTLFQQQQEAWLGAVHANLRAGGTATLMIGNGDLDGKENGIDCLASTLAAAKVV